MTKAQVKIQTSSLGLEQTGRFDKNQTGFDW